jgi:hypothetical protein
VKAYTTGPMADIKSTPLPVVSLKDCTKIYTMALCRLLCLITAEEEIPLQGQWKFSRFHI